MGFWQGRGVEKATKPYSKSGTYVLLFFSGGKQLKANQIGVVVFLVM